MNIKSKSQIIEEHCDEHYPQDGSVDFESDRIEGPLENVYAAMEEYATQREYQLKLKLGLIQNDNYTTLQFITNKINKLL